MDIYFSLLLADKIWWQKRIFKSPQAFPRRKMCVQCTGDQPECLCLPKFKTGRSNTCSDGIWRSNKAYMRSPEYLHYKGIHSFIKKKHIDWRHTSVCKCACCASLIFDPPDYTVEGEKEPHNVFLWPPHGCVHIHTKCNNNNNSKVIKELMRWFSR